MNIWKITIQNLKSKPLYTLLSIFMLALSIALLLGIQQLKSSFQHQMDNNLGKIDMVMGAKGSPLQLVLASVLHLDNPTGNISLKEAEEISKNPLIKTAVPISYGDNYRGYRIVGTTPEFLSFYDAKLKTGNPVKKSMQVVLGSTVAQRTNLKIGDTFKSSHGLIENDIDVHDDELTVVGILEPTQKVIDRLIVTNLESIWDAHNHDHGHEKDEEHEEDDHGDDKHEHHKEDAHKHDDEHHHEHGDDADHVHDHNDEHHEHGKDAEHEYNDKEHEHHDEHHHEDDHANKEITSMLLKFRSPAAILTLPRYINKETNMQAVIPKIELNKLYDFLGIGFKTINLIAYLILAISAITIFISLYKMVKERAYDLALMRTYGASNFQLIKMIFYEGIIIALLSFLLARIGLYIMFKVLESDYKQNLLQALSTSEVLQIAGIVFGMIILSITMAIYPILKMNISTILSNEK